MCWVTGSPPLRRSSFCSRTSSSSESSSTSSGNSAAKRVSFNAKVKVYDLEPLQCSERGSVYYSSNDYRRFRSDSCLEILDQQLQAQQTGRDPWSALWRKAVLWRSLSTSSRTYLSSFQRRKQTSKHLEMDYPWLTPYHPHDQAKEHQQKTQTGSSSSSDVEPLLAAAAVVPPAKTIPVSPSVPSTKDVSREKILIQELAFWSLSG